jgi:hypothetical protein
MRVNIEYYVFKLLLLFLIIATILGMVNTELLIDGVDVKIKSITRVSSYTSLVIGSFLATILLGLFLTNIYYLLKIFVKNSKYQNIYSFCLAAKNYIIVLILGQVLNCFLFIYVLYDPNLKITQLSDLERYLQSNNWAQISIILNLSTILAAVLTMSITIFIKNKNYSYYHLLITIALMLLMQLSFQYSSLKNLL